MAGNNAGDKVLWFAGGAAVGVALAILYAPAAGRETRRKIGRETAGTRDAWAGSAREIFDSGREMYERGREIVDEAAEMFERGRQMMEDAPPEESEA